MKDEELSKRAAGLAELVTGNMLDYDHAIGPITTALLEARDADKRAGEERIARKWAELAGRPLSSISYDWNDFNDWLKAEGLLPDGGDGG